MTTIYHIPGVKIGSTYRDPTKRVKEQGYTDFEILEVHESELIASKREIELQKQYGYKVDTCSRIHTVYIAGAKSRTSEAREKRGNSNRGKTRTPEAKQKMAATKKGRLHPLYGKGRKYIEITTEFIGTYTDMMRKYPGWFPEFVNRKRLNKNSKYRDLKWEVYLSDHLV